MARIYRFWLLLTVTPLCFGCVALFLLIGQTLSYHDFEDKRSFAGIPNFLNVVSNVPLLLVGAWGLSTLWQSKVKGVVLAIYLVLFSGIFLAGIGSAYYHWRPGNGTLVYDWIPMTVIFMSLLFAAVAELIDRRVGGWLLVPLVGVGVLSVLGWHWGELYGKEGLRFYALVQFYPMLAIPLILVLFYDPAYKGAIRALIWVVAWYGVAKGFELFGKPIYAAIGFSGHSLKHVAAAVSTGYLVVMFSRKYTRHETIEIHT